MNSLYITLASICLFSLTYAEQTAIPANVNRPLNEEEQTSSPTTLPTIAKPLTQEQQVDLDKEFTPTQETSGISAQAEASMTADQQESENTSAAIQQFCKQNNIPGTAFAPITPSTPVVPVFSEVAKQQEGENLKEPTRIDSDAGVYLDFEEENKIVYIKNVKLRNPEYMLDCDGELQIYFYKADNNDKQNDVKKDDDKLNAGTNELKKIIAFGNIIIKFKDKDGTWYEGRGDRLVYTKPKDTPDNKVDVKDGDLILTGNQPYLLNKGTGFLFKSWDKNGRVMYSKGQAYVPGSSTTIIREIDKKTEKKEKK